MDKHEVDEAVRLALEALAGWGITVHAVPVDVEVRAEGVVTLWFRRRLPEGTTMDPDEVPLVVRLDSKSVERVPIM